MTSQEHRVHEFFEQTDVYLRYNYNLRIRFETVRSFTAHNHYSNVLDMPSGTGEITLPLIDHFGELTLMDFSKNMIDIAKRHTPPELVDQVNFVNKNFYNHNFDSQRFDLVVSLGILAHIDQPWKFVERLSSLVTPGGHLILQNTDADHWFTRLIRFYLGFRQMTGKDKYRLNKIPARKLEQKMKEAGFERLKEFRYNQSFLGFSRFFSNNLKYRLTRNYYGDADNPKHGAQGSDATYLFRRKQ